ALVSIQFLALDLTSVLGDTYIPFTLATLLVVAVALVLYAVLVSVNRIAPLKERQHFAAIAGWILFIAGLVVFLELHAVLLRLIFEAQGYIKPGKTAVAAEGSQVFNFIYQSAKAFVLTLAPIVLVVLPFLKKIAGKAVEGAAGGWSELGKRVASRVVLIVAA